MLDTINPIMLELGGLQIRYYGLMYLAGLVFGLWIMHRFQRYDSKFPLKKDEIFDCAFIVFLGAVLGGRLGIVLFYDPLYYLEHLWEVPAIWKGGMSFHGGLIGVAIVTYLFARFKKINPFILGDYLVMPFAIALMFGRIGNFLNGELWGRITTLPFCIDYSQNPYLSSPPQGCRYPSQFFEAGKNLLVFLVLFSLYKLWHKRKPGTLLLLFLILYGVLRSLVEFIREPSWVYMGISAGQWLSLPLIIIGLTGLIVLYKNSDKNYS